MVLRTLTVHSDSWADPQKQPLPAAWPTTLELLAETVRCYVKDTLIASSMPVLILPLSL